MKPLLLVDVDGVLNPYDAKPTKRPAGYETYYQDYYDKHYGKRRRMRIWLNKTHGPMLTEWAARKGFELAWCTTWGEEANTWIAPKIGLNESWPVVNFDKAELMNPAVWKFAGVTRFAQDRSLVWLDDDFKYFKYARDEFHFRRSNFTNTTMYQVDPSVGLTETDLDKIAIHVVTQWQTF